MGAALRRKERIERDHLVAVVGSAAASLTDDELEVITRFFTQRTPAKYAATQEMLVQGLMLYFAWMEQEGGWERHLQPRVVDDLVAAAHEGREPSPGTRVAFGLLTSAHTKALIDLIATGQVDRRELLRAVYDQAAIEALVSRAKPPPARLRFRISDINGMIVAPRDDDGGDAEIVEVPLRGSVLRLLVTNEAELQQAARLESTTIAWLEQTITPASVMLDVGANVGVFSCIAGLLGAQTVVSCEPVPDNQARLVQNLRLNGVSARHAFCVAAGAYTGPAVFGVSNVGAGSWSHAGLGRAGDLDIACLAYRVDDLLRDVGGLQPTHLKVDVDGAELDVLRGAVETIAGPSLSEILVEASEGTLPDLRRMLEPYGFALQEQAFEVFGNVFFKRR